MNRITAFIKEEIQELGKVTWPSRATVIRLTIGVIIVTAIFAVFIGIVDIVLNQGIEQLVIWRETIQSQTQDLSNNIQINPEDIQVETEETQ